MNSLGSSSDTTAMSDTYQSYSARLSEFREHVRYVAGATGIAVAVGNKVVALDVFDKPSTCAKVWDRLLTGVVMDALEADSSAPAAERNEVERLLARLRDSAWEPITPVGVGQEFRFDADSETHASALVFQDSVLHGSVVVAS